MNSITHVSAPSTIFLVTLHTRVCGAWAHTHVYWPCVILWANTLAHKITQTPPSQNHTDPHPTQSLSLSQLMEEEARLISTHIISQQRLCVPPRVEGGHAKMGFMSAGAYTQSS